MTLLNLFLFGKTTIGFSSCAQHAALSRAVSPPVPEEKITASEQSLSVTDAGRGGTGEGQEPDTVAFLLYPKLQVSVFGVCQKSGLGGEGQHGRWSEQKLPPGTGRRSASSLSSGGP